MSTAAVLPAVETPQPSAGDRMAFSVFLAACLHALVLFGIGFVAPELLNPKRPITLDVILASSYNEKKPERPDFLAQANQEGGGKSKTSKPPRTSSQAQMPAPDPRPTSQPVQGGPAPQTAKQKILTASQGPLKQNVNEATPDIKPGEQSLDTASMIERSLQIASLTAELAAQQELEAREPKRRIVAPSTAKTQDAAYLDGWRRKIERIGNLNYPEEARRRALFGELVLRVDINADGTIREIRVLESSKQKVLDDAAVRIVRLAAPFAPLPPEMRKDTDILQVIRLWRFEPGNGFSAQ
ncbi:energy transducer TonB [Permianibacter sp. IMCC34836]|uniref:energy transducer TonB n=1 Tax=Permianibacter fluminis TaxID=2738515 RepID=UPI001552A5BE|nr:energy transducer TonB [Permianibacter fluminis]NQD35807.1 energy transducer TonB [Permianibacter fluminis]